MEKEAARGSFCQRNGHNHSSQSDNFFYCRQCLDFIPIPPVIQQEKKEDLMPLHYLQQTKIEYFQERNNNSPVELFAMGWRSEKNEVKKKENQEGTRSPGALLYLEEKIRNEKKILSLLGGLIFLEDDTCDFKVLTEYRKSQKILNEYYKIKPDSMVLIDEKPIRLKKEHNNSDRMKLESFERATRCFFNKSNVPVTCLENEKVDGGESIQKAIDRISKIQEEHAAKLELLERDVIEKEMEKFLSSCKENTTRDESCVVAMKLGFPYIVQFPELIRTRLSEMDLTYEPTTVNGDYKIGFNEKLKNELDAFVSHCIKEETSKAYGTSIVIDMKQFYPNIIKKVEIINARLKKNGLVYSPVRKVGFGKVTRDWQGSELKFSPMTDVEKEMNDFILMCTAHVHETFSIMICMENHYPCIAKKPDLIRSRLQELNMSYNLSPTHNKLHLIAHQKNPVTKEEDDVFEKEMNDFISKCKTDTSCGLTWWVEMTKFFPIIMKKPDVIRARLQEMNISYEETIIKGVFKITPQKNSVTGVISKEVDDAVVNSQSLQEKQSLEKIDRGIFKITPQKMTGIERPEHDFARVYDKKKAEIAQESKEQMDAFISHCLKGMSEQQCLRVNLNDYPRLSIEAVRLSLLEHHLLCHPISQNGNICSVLNNEYGEK